MVNDVEKEVGTRWYGCVCVGGGHEYGSKIGDDIQVLFVLECHHRVASLLQEDLPDFDEITKKSSSSDWYGCAPSLSEKWFPTTFCSSRWTRPLFIMKLSQTLKKYTNYWMQVFFFIYIDKN